MSFLPFSDWRSVYDLPLSAFTYRWGTYCIPYRQSIGGIDYLVFRAQANHPVEADDERYWSAFSIKKYFSYGVFDWYGYESRAGAGQRETFWGLEARHGIFNQGAAAFWRDTAGIYWFRTSTGGATEDTNLGAQNWSARTQFTINWEAAQVRAYIDGAGPVATHAAQVPNEPMGFFIEVSHEYPPNTPAGDTHIYYDWQSFTYTPP